jgi:hypothetical protein
MQPPISPMQRLSLSIDLTQSHLNEGYVVCDVTLRHPFPSMNIYRGFDVHGICMGDGSFALGHDSSARFSQFSTQMDTRDGGTPPNSSRSGPSSVISRAQWPPRDTLPPRP